MSPHGCGGKCEGDSHDHESSEMGVEYSLYSKINKDNLQCLNEENEGSGKTIFKPWEERTNFDTVVQSDADEELLFNIPFTGNVKLKGIIVVGAEDESHPSKMRIFKNRPSMTFDDISCTPDQEFDLHKDNTGSVEYSTKVVTFNNVHHLTLHFPSNFGGDKTRIYYIGLRGEYSEPYHHGVTICNYESRPMISDHKNALDEISSHRGRSKSIMGEINHRHKPYVNHHMKPYAESNILIFHEGTQVLPLVEEADTTYTIYYFYIEGVLKEYSEGTKSTFINNESLY